MAIAFEPAMAALFAALQGAATLNFTATAASASATLESVSDFTSLFAGLPVFAPGVVTGTTIAALDEGAGTLTLSNPIAADGGGVDIAFTTGFLTTGRRVKPWTKVADQPALFLRRIGTSDAPDEFFPVTTLECEIWIYSQAGQDPDAVPDAALSNLDQMVRAAFQPDDPGGDPRFTLGGLVYWCRIEGRSDYSPGDLNGQGISRIPVRILLP